MKTVVVNGDTHQFPDSATDDDISNALKSYYSGGNQAAGGDQSGGDQSAGVGGAPPANDTNAAVNSFTGGAIEGVPIVGPVIKAGADRAAAGIRSLMYGTPYADELQAVQGYAQNAAEQNPGLNTAGQIAGGIGSMAGLGATATGAKLLGTTAGTTIPQMLLRGAGSGAAISAADAAIRGEDPVKATILGGILGGGGNLLGHGISNAISSAATTGATKAAPLAIEQLKDAARPTFQNQIAAGNVLKYSPSASEQLAQGIKDQLHTDALRPSNAGRTYRELTRLSGAQDMNDVSIARDKMRDIANGISENKLIKVAGSDSNAARKAMVALDNEMESRVPGWIEQMKTADANWAAARRADTVLKEAGKNRLGSFANNETRTKGYTPDELAAIKAAHMGGPAGAALNAIGSSMNPFHGGLPSALASGPAAWLSSGATIPVGMAADVAARNLKKRALDAAVQKVLSRSPVGQAAVPAPVVRPPVAPTPNNMGLLLRGAVNPLLFNQSQ